jgi:hypothetical protein
MRFLIITLLLFICTTAESQRWYKGNTHTHTVICGHADTSPEDVVKWYHERDYNFLILSEHNHFIDPDSVEMPADQRKDFILIPGQEVTGALSIHTTGMNTRALAAWDMTSAGADEEFTRFKKFPNSEPTQTELMQLHVDAIRDKGGLPILNHPNFSAGVPVDNIRAVEGLHMFELYNGHPAVFNWGKEGHEAVEEKWDMLLTQGMFIYGVSSDDAHTFAEMTPDQSNPGRGWVMVRSRQLTPDAITEAVEDGRFYASSGIVLNKVSHSREIYDIEINVRASLRTLESPFLIGRRLESAEEGFLIEFIRKGGEVVRSIRDTKASYSISPFDQYVRARISYCKAMEDGSFMAYYAWTQPRFVDERAALQENKIE